MEDKQFKKELKKRSKFKIIWWRAMLVILFFPLIFIWLSIEIWIMDWIRYFRRERYMKKHGHYPKPSKRYSRFYQKEEK